MRAARLKVAQDHFLVFFLPSEFSCHMPSINASGSIEWSHDLD